MRSSTDGRNLEVCMESREDCRLEDDLDRVVGGVTVAMAVHHPHLIPS